jgi:hypothetical protein
MYKTALIVSILARKSTSRHPWASKEIVPIIIPAKNTVLALLFLRDAA